MVLAIRADGSGDVTNSHVAWQNDAVAVSTISPTMHGDSLVCLNEEGVLTCLDGGTGKLQWRRQLPGLYAVSPLLAGDELLCLNTQGTAFVVDLKQRGNVVSEHVFAAGVLASPAVTSRQILLRGPSGLVGLPWEAAAPPLVHTPGKPPKRL